MNVHGWTKTHGVWGVVGQRMRQACREALPDDSHEKARGRLVVAVHRVKPLQLRPSMIDRFHSRDDLVEACYCSSFIPLFLEPSLSAKWRGERWIDGGFVDMLPPVPPHIEGSQKIIKSLPFELLARMRSDRDDIITFPKDSHTIGRSSNLPFGQCTHQMMMLSCTTCFKQARIQQMHGWQTGTARTEFECRQASFMSID